MFCSANGSTRRMPSEKRKICALSAASESDFMNRSTNSENCIIEPDTSHSSTSLRRRLRFFR